MARYPLDAKGLLCPLPVLRARKAMKPLNPGDILAVEATDNAAPADFAAFCAATGHRLLASGRDGDTYRFDIEKAADAPTAGT